jgi:hypothetical protein
LLCSVRMTAWLSRRALAFLNVWPLVCLAVLDVD